MTFIWPSEHRGGWDARFMSEGTPALVAQLDMIEWERSEFGGIWAEWFMRTLSGSKLRSLPDPQSAASVLLSTVREAETVFVSKDMCMLIEHAARTMPDVPVQAENLMWKKAFIYFERPIEHEVKVAEGDPELLRTRAILSIHTNYVVQSEFPDDAENSHVKAGLAHVTFVDLDQTKIDYEDAHTRLFPYDLSAWTYGKRWETVPEDESEGPFRVDEGLGSQRKLLLATHLIAAQYIAVRSPQKPSRQLRRRVERMDKPLPNYGDIVYITLRRNSARVGERETSEEWDGYSHRFPVKGYWKHQYYSSKGEHHLIFVEPYIKGPPDKPLIIKDKVYRLVR